MHRPHLSLWLLLCAAFVAVVCISVFGPVNIFGYELKDSGIAAALTRPQAAAASSDPSHQNSQLSLNSSLSTLNSPLSPLNSSLSTLTSNPVPVDSAPKTILFFGDSMLDGLYPRLAAYADHNGHTLYAVIWYSSTSEVWGRSDKLAGYIRRLRPDFIFVSLGANELFVKDIAQKRDQYVKKILADIGDIPYVWIGPPNWKPDTGINALLAANVARGCFFLSDGMKFDRKKDGAHPTNESANLWMDSIARWMPLHGAHPILLDKPEKSRSRASRVFVHQPSEK